MASRSHPGAVAGRQWATTRSHFNRARPGRAVEMVGWTMRQAFVRKLNERDPVLAVPASRARPEWEYACLARTSKDRTARPRRSRGSRKLGGTTHPAGLKQPMLRALRYVCTCPEWTQDTWHADYRAPPTGRERLKGGESPYHTLRGGGWDSPRSSCTPHFRGPTRDSPKRIPRRGGPP